MASIFKRGRVWYIDVRYKGRRIRRKVGTSKKVAELALHDAEVKIAKEEFGFVRKDLSIDRLIEDFLEYNRTNHRASTAKRYKAITDHLQAYLAAKRSDVIALSQLTPQVIEGYKTWRRDQWVNPNGRPVDSEDDVTDSTRMGARSRTVNLEVDGIKTMLNLAIKWGYLKENPVKQVKPLKTDDRKPVRYLTVEECQQLLEASSPLLRDVYFTFLNTGMRKSELENLRWSDVDLQRRKIRICWKPDWQPKTGERDIPMGDSVYELIRDLKQKSNGDSTDDYVFPVKNSGHSHNWLRTELIKVAREAGISDLTKVHTLRHTFASLLFERRENPVQIQRWMGHASLKVTLDTYTHLIPDDEVDPLDLSAELDGGGGNAGATQATEMDRDDDVIAEAEAALAGAIPS